MTARKWAAVLLCAALMTGLGGFADPAGMKAMALVDKKITSVSLAIDANFEAGESIQNQQVEITSGTDKYTAGDVEFLNAGFTWSESDVPEIRFPLYAEDGYRFDVNKDRITIKGGTLLDMRGEDSYHTLVLTVSLPSLVERNSPIDAASWSSLTTGAWSPSTGAGSYEVRLFRDGTGVGTTKTVEGTGYNFSNAMTKAGTYSYRVRPVNKVNPENKGDWVESPSKIIDSQEAVAILQSRGTGQWKQDDTGWWYSNADGSYPVSCWKQIDGSWYFFNAQGYMATGWVDWNGNRYYCDAKNGNMLTDTTTPDGHQVGADGAAVK